MLFPTYAIRCKGALTECSERVATSLKGSFSSTGTSSSKSSSLASFLLLSSVSVGVSGVSVSATSSPSSSSLLSYTEGYSTSFVNIMCFIQMMS
jgi:hypothetical protein